jgi:hypothetical protein
MNTPQIVDTALAAAHATAAPIKAAIAQKLAYVADYETGKYGDRSATVARLQLDIEKLEASLTPIKAEIAELNAKFTGWTRAFLVANGNGHVHTSTSCSTCFSTTDFLWLPEWSGKDESAIIEAAGEAACSICFPNAPVDTRNRPSQIQDPAKVALRAEREAKKAEREAKAIATGITNPDGSALVIDRSVIKTERTAAIEAVDALFWNLAYPNGGGFQKNAEKFEKLVAALAFKRGTSIEEQTKLLTAKAEKKVAA